MKKVFLSYARDDYAFAHKFLEALQNVSVEGWMDNADIAAGTATSVAMRSAIRSSSAVLVLISPQALESRWVDFEIGAGLALERQIIPILIEGPHVEDILPEPLRGMKFIDARNRSTQEVVREVERALSTVNPAGSSQL